MAERAILVSGASGFIGNQLTKRLLAEGRPVRALVRDRDRVRNLDGVATVQGDILRAESLVPAIEGAELVFHCAALVGSEALSLSEYESVNVGGTRNLLDACRKSGSVKRVVHVSSLGVTGSLRPGCLLNEESQTSPRTPYQKSKLSAERVVLASGLPAVIARPAWAYGVGSRSTEKLFRAVARRRMAIVGDGRNETQPIEIADLVDGLLRCASTEGAAGQIYHFAGPRPISIEELLREIAVAVGVPPPCLRIPMSAAVAAAGFFEWVYPRALGRPPIDRGRLEFFRVWHAYSLEKSRRELGWQPATEFPEGAQRVARELRARRMLT